MKKGKYNPNVSYHNFVLQTAEDTFRSVSYKPELHKKLQDAEQAKSLVPNKFNSEQIDAHTTKRKLHL